MSADQGLVASEARQEDHCHQGHHTTAGSMGTSVAFRRFEAWQVHWEGAARRHEHLEHHLEAGPRRREPLQWLVDHTVALLGKAD
jgi:hypothetical protein